MRRREQTQEVKSKKAGGAEVNRGKNGQMCNWTVGKETDSLEKGTGYQKHAKKIFKEVF